MPDEIFPLGDRVICDWGCAEDYTHRDDVGGLLFAGSAVCPRCAPELERGAREVGEASFITKRCPEGMPFRVWVVTVLRGGQAGAIVVRTDDAALAELIRRAHGAFERRYTTKEDPE